MPEEMREQLPYLWKILEAMRIPTLEEPGFEADDIIGTLAIEAVENGLDAYIVSGDKDFMQLINEHIFLYAPSGRQAEIKVYDREGVIERWGVPPEKIIDLLGLMGDSSDNVPGVAGVGVKTAVKLLNEYGTLESALDHADEVKNKRAREGLQKCREEAVLSQELVTIITDMNINADYKDMVTDGFDVNAMDEIFRELDQPSDASIPQIAFWIRVNVGTLNNLINTEYTIDTATLEISPDPAIEEKSILKRLYVVHFYDLKLRGSLGAAAQDSILEVSADGATVKKIKQK
jgi:5'-3' exonuclease